MMALLVRKHSLPLTAVSRATARSVEDRQVEMSLEEVPLEVGAEECPPCGHRKEWLEGVPGCLGARRGK